MVRQAEESANPELIESTRIRVLTVDDHPLLREGITAIINNQSDMVVAAGASSGREGLRCFASTGLTSR